MSDRVVPKIRIQNCNEAPIRADGDFVLYWMIAFRRTTWNFSLQRAIELAVELQKPLVIFEPLRIGYQWASDRIHRFVIDGMAENAARIAALKNPGVLYFPYVEPTADAGKGLLAALAERACVVVTDDFPSFFLPRMVLAAAAKLPVRMESVDSNGLLPLRATDRVFTTAFSFRAFLQKQLPEHLEQFPQPDPLAVFRSQSRQRLGSRAQTQSLARLATEITTLWPSVFTSAMACVVEDGLTISRNALASGSNDGRMLEPDASAFRLIESDAQMTSVLATLPIDHTVGVVETRGGATAAHEKLTRFLDQSLPRYAAGANDPDADNRSGLSPYLHFGHISPHELFHELMSREEWSPHLLGEKTGGKRAGWWGTSPGAESWLDEFITWRELGYNMTSHREDYDQYESLPDWAQATLAKHATDRREYVYSLDEFAAAATHDALWNAAQTQLVREGRIHNYLRMLWGKKILEWTATPRDALDVMIELNNRYALDGRNPNSYSGIFWVLGRYDRAWGPERPIFGTVRYMSSDNTRKKVRVREYLKIYGRLKTID